MAETEISFSFAWTSFPRRNDLEREIRTWLINTNPIPGLKAGEKPGRVVVAKSYIKDEDIKEVYVQYEGGYTTAFGSGCHVKVSFAPGRVGG